MPAPAITRLQHKNPDPAKKPHPPEARSVLNMRVRPEVRQLIDQAAELVGKNRTDFVLDAARQAAEHALLDRTLVALPAKSHAAFLKLLDAPPQPNARLRKSLKTPSAWD